jgi:hypothetical protein
MLQTPYRQFSQGGRTLPVKYLFFSLLFCAGGWAQTINSVSATATQALVQFTAPTSPACTIQVSENVNFSPLAADGDPSLFTGANTEAAHLVNSWASGSNTTRTLRIGLRRASLALDGFRHSRALAANTLHYFAVTCNGTAATTTFMTGVPGGIAPEPPPTDSTAWGQLTFPEFTDFSKPVIEPRTGLKIYSADPGAWSSSQTVPISANWLSGAAGWTNTGNIPSYGTAVASTANTNTLAVYLDASAYADGLYDIGGYWPYDNFLDLGLDLYGSGTDGAAVNRTIRACLSLDSGQTCYTSYATSVLPSGSNVASGTVPSQYPAAYFSGWGKPLPRNAWPKRGSVTAAAGVVTLTKDVIGLPIGAILLSVGSYFDQDWAAGTKIFITGSSATCTNSFCTIASVESALQLTLVENLTQGESAFRSAALAVILNKTTATGSINISARWKLAKGYPHDIWSGGCATTAVTSGDGITGYPCIFPRVRQDAGGLYFVGTSSPVVRLVSLFVNRGCTNSNSLDCPNGAIVLLGPSTPQFDPVDPRIMYIARTTAGNINLSLFKVVYSGNWSALNIAYQNTGVNPPVTTELTWTNLTPPSTGNSLRDKILANTSYNEAEWPVLANIQTSGLTGPYMVFSQNIGSQDTACWVFAFTASTGAFYRAWRTDDGSSDPILHYSGCHAVQPIDGTTTANGPAVLVANNNLHNSNSAVPLGGPWAGAIVSVYRNGSFSSNTALPWPIDNTYDNACPNDLAQWIVDRGASGNQCVRMQITQPCSAFPASGEAAGHPCPYDAAKSYLGPLAVGDFIKDPSRIGGYDTPGLMVVRINYAGTGDYTFQRNANFSYCAFGTPASAPPKDGVAFASQLQHPNGWAYNAVGRDSCNSSLLLLDVAGGSIYAFNQNITRGHFDLTESGVQTTTMIGNGALNALNEFQYPIQFQRAWANIFNFSDFTVPEGPSFARYQSDHDNQSYVDAKQFNASATLKQYAFDFRHYNGPTGYELEGPNQTVGNTLNLALQGGTTSVYKVSFTGAVDVKHQALNVWAGEKYLIEKSSAAAGNTLTDSDPFKFCYAYNAGECRTGSSAGDLYAAVPRMDSKTSCWASQMNLRIPCAMAGPTQGMQVTQVKVSGPDPQAAGQRWLGSMLMGPEQQYVYSKVLPTPDASYLLFAGFLTSGYHTGLMMAKLPPFSNDSMVRSTYVPVTVSGTGASVYVEFGYDEYGSDGVTKFYCATRAENCRVAAAAIDENTPFKFASEALTNANGYSIAIPALPGHILYYHVVSNGVAGPAQTVAVQ